MVDHSYVQELLDSGVIPPAKAEVNPERHVITGVWVGMYPAADERLGRGWR